MADEHIKRIIFKEYTTPPNPCSYYEDSRDMMMAIEHPVSCTSSELYNHLALHGCRRQGTIIYKTCCPQCRDCISSRVPADEFRPNRTMRKLLKRNSDLTLIPIRDPKPTSEYYDLYQRYEASRHVGSMMTEYSYGEFREALFETNVNTILLETRLGRELVSLAIVDLFTHGVSAVYTFFSPDYPARSLGTFSILKQIGLARARGAHQYLYLGYWLYELPQMDYNRLFKPFQVFWDSRWQLLEDCEDEIRESRDRSRELAACPRTTLSVSI